MVTLVVVSFFLSLVSCQEPSRDRETTRRRFFDRLDHREILKARDIFRIIGGHFRNVSCRRPATALSTSSRSVHGVHAWRLEIDGGSCETANRFCESYCSLAKELSINQWRREAAGGISSNQIQVQHFIEIHLSIPHKALDGVGKLEGETAIYSCVISVDAANILSKRTLREGAATNYNIIFVPL
jgi:hypothetical protein